MAPSYLSHLFSLLEYENIYNIMSISIILYNSIIFIISGCFILFSYFIVHQEVLVLRLFFSETNLVGYEGERVEGGRKEGEGRGMEEGRER